MNFSNVARYSLVALSLLAASCTPSTTQQNLTGSDDNGANCAGTAVNKESCINNQNRMN